MEDTENKQGKEDAKEEPGSGQLSSISVLHLFLIFKNLNKDINYIFKAEVTCFLSDF